MPSNTSEHPTDAELSSFTKGKLDDESAARVEAHISVCPACRAMTEPAVTEAMPQLSDPPRPILSASDYSTQGSVSGNDSPTIPPIPTDVPVILRDHPRYRILSLLGRGGMGVVYKAEHKVMERPVAIKVISGGMLQKSEMFERFHREVRAAAKLDHPNIVKAYDAEQAGDLQLLAMEYVDGRSLSELVRKKGPLPVEDACEYVRQAALGLQHAFEHGMVHRDLKPHNLMLTPSGVVKVLDFGLAKLASEQSRPGGDLTQENTVMGTPEYMAPEQAMNSKTADVRADIYALGCTLYCLLTGRPPFTGDSALAIVVAQAQQAPQPIESLRPETPPALAALVAKMLAKDPAARPQTPKEVAEALTPFAMTNTTKSMTSVDGANPSRLGSTAAAASAGNKRLLLPLALAACLVLTLVGLWAGGMFSEAVARKVVPDAVQPVAATPPAEKAAKKPGMAELEQVELNLRRLVVGTSVERAKTKSDTVRELKAAMTAVQGQGPSNEIAPHLEKVQQGIIALREAVGAANRQSIREAEDNLTAASKALQIELPPIVTSEKPKANPPAPTPPPPVASEKPKTNPPPPPKTITVDLGGGVTIELLRVPAGSFTMGSPKNESERHEDETEHPVRISKDFYLGKYPVTQAQYAAIIGKNPSYFSGTGGGKDKVAGMDVSQFPVESVSWQDAAAFCSKLSARDPKKRQFRLPTEAEWEFACRSGTNTAYYFGTSLNGSQANCNGELPYGAKNKGPHLDRTSRVGSFEAIAPHPWGLCDLHGNVGQWCQDWYDAGYYTRSPPVDPICTDGEQKHHVIRGGSWGHAAKECRAANRMGSTLRLVSNFVGFRAALRLD